VRRRRTLPSRVLPSTRAVYQVPTSRRPPQSRRPMSSPGPNPANPAFTPTKAHLSHLRHYANISYLTTHKSSASNDPTVRLPQAGATAAAQETHEKSVMREAEGLRERIKAEREVLRKVYIHLHTYMVQANCLLHNPAPSKAETEIRKAHSPQRPSHRRACLREKATRGNSPPWSPRSNIPIKPTLTASLLEFGD